MSFLRTRPLIISDYPAVKDVHKQPALDLVGWFTVTPESGPTIAHLPIHQQILAYSETPLLLAFHSSALGPISVTSTGRLPLSLYESAEEYESAEASKGKEKDPSAMQVDKEDTSYSIRFRPIPYSVETEETEMIGIDYVAKGGGNAAAIDTPSSPENTAISSKKGKRRSKQDDIGPNTLSAEEQDLVANLSTRLNSVRMLQSRIGLLQKALKSMPPSYLHDASTPLTTSAPSPDTLPHLRQVNSLVTRLSLLTPAPIVTDETNPTSQVEFNLTAQSNDVNLAALLSLLGKNIQGASELGKKLPATESVRKPQNPAATGGGGGGGRFDFVGDQFAEPEYDGL